MTAVESRSKRATRLGRLRRPQDFTECFRRGRMVKNSLLVVHLMETGQPTRVGFSVSRKLGKAVVRNRVKRRLREAVRRVADKVPDGYDVVISARVRAKEAPFAQLVRAVEQALEGSGSAGRPLRSFQGRGPSGQATEEAGSGRTGVAGQQQRQGDPGSVGGRGQG